MCVCGQKDDVVRVFVWLSMKGHSCLMMDSFSTNLSLFAFRSPSSPKPFPLMHSGVCNLRGKHVQPEGKLLLSVSLSGPPLTLFRLVPLPFLIVLEVRSLSPFCPLGFFLHCSTSWADNQLIIEAFCSLIVALRNSTELIFPCFFPVSRSSYSGSAFIHFHYDSYCKSQNSFWKQTRSSHFEVHLLLF